MKKLLLYLFLTASVMAQTTRVVDTNNLPSWQVGSTNIPISVDSYGRVVSTGGGGAGTVTTFTSGNLSPLFTTSVAAPTLTPALSFTLSTHAANTVFAGPTTGADDVPTFRSMVAADLPSTVVTAASALTSTALMTGGGSRAAQTPAATATMDASGNIQTPGSIATGVGGSVAGTVQFGQGTLPSTTASTIKVVAPASVTAYTRTLEGAVNSTGFYYGTVSGTNVTDTKVGETGTGSVVRATSPTLVTPALGTPSALVLANATGGVVAGGGTGVASLTAYAPVFGGTTSTGAVQSGTAGTTGQLLRSGGASAVATWTTATFPVTAGTSGNVLTSDGTNWSSAAPTGGGSTPNSALFTATADGANNATASDTSIIGTGVGSKTTTAAYFSAGTNLLMVIKGTISTAATPDNLTIKIKAGSVVVASASGVSLTGLLSGSNFEMLALVTCRTSGASGTFKVNSLFAVTGSALTPLEAKVVDTGNAVDTTGTIAWDVTAAWASTTAGDIITGTNFTMWTPGMNVDDTAFASSWNAVTTQAPSKNAVYDWGHTFDTDDNGKVNVLDLSSYGAVMTNSSGVVSNVAPSTSGNVLTSNGSAWVSSAAAAGVTGFGTYIVCQGTTLGATFSSTTTLAINGGSVYVQLYVPVNFALDSIVYRNMDSSAAHTLEWSLYQGANVATLTQVAGAVGTYSFTPIGASNESSTATGAPVTLAPGQYWLVLRNTHASNTAGVGNVTTGNLGGAVNTAQTATIGSALGGTLDFTANSPTKVTNLYGIVIKGRVFGQGSAF